MLSLNPAGELRWSYEGGAGSAQAVDVDAQGHVFVAGNERVIQLGPDGKLLWKHEPEWASLYHPPIAYGIRLNSSGGAVVSGSQTRRGPARVEKLDAQGQPLWEYLDSERRGAGVAVDIDPEGNAVVVGEVAADWLMLGLDPSGKLLWRFTYDGGGGPRNPDNAHAVAFHPSGGFIVAGAIHPVPPKPPSLGTVYWRVARYRVVDARN